MEEQLRFGFLPTQALQDINDLGNWKNRSHAIEQVQRGLSGLSDKTQLLQQLQEFVEFVTQLLQDHNFKVAIAGLNILADLSSKLGTLLQTHLSELAAGIYAKLLDQRAPVRAAAVKACGSLMSHTLPSSPIPLLSRLLLQHQEGQQQQGDSGAAAQQDCSGLLEVLVLAQLSYAVSKLDMAAAAQLLVSCTGPSATPRQQALALEGLALATDALGPQLPPLLRQAGAAEVQITHILQHTAQLQRPLLAGDSSVLHGSTVTAAANNEAASGGSGGSGFSIKSFNSSSFGSRSRTEGGVGNGVGAGVGAGVGGGCSLGGGLPEAADISLSKFGALKLGGVLPVGNSSALGSMNGPASRLLWTVPVAAGSCQQSRPPSNVATQPLPLQQQQQLQQQQPHQQFQQQQQQQLLPPGSLGALAAHAELIRNARDVASAGGAIPAGDTVGAFGIASAAVRSASVPVRYDMCQSSSSQQPGAIAGLGSSSNLSPPIGSPIASLRASAGGWDVSAGLGGVRASLGSSRRSSAESHEDLVAAAAAAAAANSGSGAGLNSSSMSSASGAGHNCSSTRSSGTGSTSSIAAAATSAAAQARLELPKSRFYGEDALSEQLAAIRTSSTQLMLNSTESCSSPAADSSAAASEAAAPGFDMHQTPSSNGRYQQPPLPPCSPSATQQQLFNRSLQQGSLGGQVLGLGPGSGLGSAANTPSPDLGVAEAATLQQQEGGSSSSWLAAAAGGSGWAQLDGSLDSNASASSGRPETLSPSRGERLAQLKRRQNEKRGSSASGGARSSPIFGNMASGDLSLSPSASADAEAGYLGPAGAGAGNASGIGGISCSSSAGDDGFSYSARSCSTGLEAAGTSARVPSPLLKWQLHTAPDCRPLLPPSARSTSQQQPEQQQQQPGSPSLMHLRSMPLAHSPDSIDLHGWGSAAAGGGAGSSYSMPNSSSTSGVGPFRRQQQAAGRLGGQGTLSAAAAEPAPQPYSPTSYRTSSAAAVLTGGSGVASSSGSGSGGSPLHTNRRFGGAAVGGGSAQSPSSLSPDSGRKAAGSMQGASGSVLRAQTAAPAVGLNSDWGSAGLGSGSSSGESPGRGSPSTVSRGGSGSAGRRGTLDRPQSVGVDAEMDLAPMHDPEASLRQVIAKFQQSNTAARKELDWQGQLEALMDARRLAAHHPEVLMPAAHELVLAALPAVDELRSTTARVALQLFQELPLVLGRGLDRELDDIVPVLLKKAGELSTAGRDNFLAAEADKALSALCAVVSDSRALSALMASGTAHKSPHVRCRAAAHLDEVAAGGTGLEGLVRNNWQLLDRLFKAAALFLQEGSLDTRTYGKRLIWAVKEALRGNRTDMDRLLTGIGPEAHQRRVLEVLEGLSAAPPPPPIRNGGGQGSRAPSRGPGVPSTPPSAHLASNGSSSAATSPATPGTPPSGPAAGGGGGPAGRGYNSAGSNSGSRARRALLSAGSGSPGCGGDSASKLQVQGAGAAGGSGGSGSGSNGSSSSGGFGSADGANNKNRMRTNSTDPSSGSSSGAGFSIPQGPPGPMSPELQEAVDQVGTHLGSKDWRNRSDALAALSALLPALPEVPNGALEGLLNGLVARLSDGNAKVNIQALQVVSEVVSVVGSRSLLVLASLVPALTANLGSTNERVCSAAGAAMDVLVGVVEPPVLLQNLSHTVMNSSSTRSKTVLIEKLASLAPQVYRYQPQVVVKQLLPAAFALAMEAKGELKPAVVQLLAVLSHLMGSAVLMGHAGAVSGAMEARVRDLLPGTRTSVFA